MRELSRNKLDIALANGMPSLILLYILYNIDNRNQAVRYVLRYSFKADFHLTGSDRIGTKEDIPLVEIDVN